MQFLDERLPARFWDKCMPEPNTGCWLWTAATNPAGYGRFGNSRHTALAHRFAYAGAHGEVAADLQLDHLCKTKCCVNPAHLEPVTARENTQRWAASITRCPAGHEYTTENTYLKQFVNKHRDGSARAGVSRQCLACAAQRERNKRARRKAA